MSDTPPNEDSRCGKANISIIRASPVIWALVSFGFSILPRLMLSGIKV
jgi:putative solute:sodium symporter small subunit